MRFETAVGPRDLGRGPSKASSARDLNLSTTKQLQMISGMAASRAERDETAAERLRWWGLGGDVSYSEVIGRRGSCGLQGI